METNKRLILKLGAVLVSALLFLTFFSNTIYTLNIPGVTADFPTSGIIMRTNRAEGMVDFSENLYLYADVAGKITLSAAEGDMVSEGDSLFTLRSDLEDLRDRLLSETNRLEKLILDMEKAEAELNYRQNQLNELKPEKTQATEVSPPDTGLYDYEMERLSEEIESAEKEYESLLLLYEADAVSRESLMEIETRIAKLNAEYRLNEGKKEKALGEYRKAVQKAAEEDRLKHDDQLKAYEVERQSIMRSIDDLRYQIESHTLDENEARRVIGLLNAQIDAGGVVTVYAESGGVVREISSGVDNGAFIERNRQVMRVGVISSCEYPYRTKVLFPESVDYLSVNDSIKLNIKSSGQYNLTGVVEKLGFENGRLRADIVFAAAPLNGGEKVEAVAELVSPLFDNVLPNSAIRKDNDGDFILYVERIPNSMMGYSYYARKMPVYIITQDERNTAFGMFSDVTEPIIINSDRPVTAGDRIRLVNGNELVGTR